MKNKRKRIRGWIFYLAAALLYQVSISAAAQSNGEIARYHLDESVGLFADASGNGYPATRYGGVAQVVGVISQGQHFDGSSGYVDSLVPQWTGPFSVTAWIKPDTVTPQQYVISQGRDYWGSGWSFYLLGGTLYFTVNTDSNDNGNEVLVSIPYTDLSQWHHIAGTYDGITASLYLDGQLRATAPGSGLPVVYRYGERFTLGRLGFAGGFFPYQGSLDEVALSTRALTAAEVLAQKRKTVGPASPTNFNSLPVTSTKIQLSWSAPPENNLRYHLYRNGALVGTSVEPFMSDSGLTVSTAYTYTVAAVDASNIESLLSDSITETTLSNAAPVFAPPPVLPYDQIHAVTWYPFPTPTHQSLTELQTALPFIQQTGFNTLWFGGNSWIDYEPTALPTPSYNTQAFANLRGILDLLRAHNMKAIIGLNYLGTGWSPAGIDSCQWVNDLTMYKAFENYATRVLTELSGYEDMVYIVVFTEGTDAACGPNRYPTPLVPVLQSTLGSLPLRLSPALRSKFRIGYHDYSVITEDWGYGTSPIQAPFSFDFLSMVAYNINLQTNTEIVTTLDTKRARFNALYPATPLILGETGADHCSPYSDADQTRANSTVISYSLGKPMGFNLWEWKSLPDGLECNPLNSGLGINLHDGVTPRPAVAAIKSLLVSATPPPTVTITNPTAGSNVSGSVSISVTATSIVEISRVEVYIDGQLQETLINAPYQWAWATTPIANGEHQIKAIAYDILGHTGIETTQVTTINTPPSTLTLTTSLVQTDLHRIKMMGIKRIRLITTARIPGDTAIASWPSNIFISFPTPTQSELAALRNFLLAVNQEGLTYEVVLLMPDSSGQYYSLGTTTNDYKTFIDTLWPTLFTGSLERIMLGGDMNPTANASHRQWLSTLWPYITQKCPACATGIEVLTTNSTLWDQGVANISWIRSNLAPTPSFLGIQYYPTSAAWLQGGGYVLANGTYDWNQLISDWYSNLLAASGGIPLVADEVGVGPWFGLTESDQNDALVSALSYLSVHAVPFNLWEFADHYDFATHIGTGPFGLMDNRRVIRKAMQTLTSLLSASNASALSGIEYNPPESVGWQFINIPFTPVNRPPTVSACTPSTSPCPAQTITLPSFAVLSGTASDDGIPNGTLTTTWSVVSGPGSVTFRDNHSPVTNASFSAPGTYVLQLSADDGQSRTSSPITIQVNPASSGPGPIDGTFVAEEILSVNLSTYFDEIKNLGLSTIVLWGTRNKTPNAGCAGTTFEWTKDPYGSSSAPSPFPGRLQAILDQASSHGMGVYIGLDNSISECGTAFMVAPSANATIADTAISAAQILAAYGNHSAFKGWYIPDEPALAHWSTIDIQGAAPYYAGLVSAVKTAEASANLPHRPILVAPYSSPDAGTPSAVAQNALLFQNLSGVDIQAWQDGVGSFALALYNPGSSTVADYFSAFSSALFPGSLWGDIEIFNGFNDTRTTAFPGGYYRPASMARLNNQLYQTRLAAKRLCWAQPQHMSTVNDRPNVLEGSARLLDSYKALYLNVGQYLTPAGYAWMTPPHVAFPDLTNSKLTDRQTGSPKYYTDPAWVGVVGSAQAQFDLGSTKKIRWIGAHVLNSTAQGIQFPTQLHLEYSYDNVHWTDAGTWPLPATVGRTDAQATDYVLANPAALGIQARYLRIQLVNSPGVWTFLSEIEMIGDLPVNQPPAVSAGPDKTITLPDNANLIGDQLDDGLIQPLTLTWSKLSGPGTVSFGTPNTLTTTAGFSTAGTYGIQLSVYDGQYTTVSSMTATVNPVPFPVLSATPTTLTFNTGVGGLNPPVQNINLTNSGNADSHWTAVSDAPWLLVSPGSGVLPATYGSQLLGVSVVMGTLSAGRHLGHLTFTDEAGIPVVVTVTFNINAPNLTLTPTALSFSASASGANPPTQTLQVTNPGAGDSFWSATSDASWLTVSPINGTALAVIGSQLLSVQVTVGVLQAGTYTGHLTFTDQMGVPKIVTVTFTIPSPQLNVTPTTLNFTAIAGGGNPLDQTLQVTNIGAGNSNWTATSDAPWLSVSPSFGTALALTGSQLLSVSAVTGALSAGPHLGHLTFTDQTTIPKVVTVTFNVQGTPNLVLTKSADVTTAHPGDHITFTIQYQNIGNANALSPVINDDIPSGTTLVVGSISNGGTLSANRISWNLGTVPVGGGGTVSFQVTVN